MVENWMRRESPENIEAYKLNEFQKIVNSLPK
jgi:hypothetical protein